MKIIKVEKKLAEKTRKLLLEKGFFAKEFIPESDSKFVYFPSNAGETELKKLIPHSFYFSRKKLRKVVKKTFEDFLKESGKFSEKELSKVISSYDQLNDIALIEIPRELRKKRKEIGKALLKSNPRLKTVLEKNPVKGEYRVRKVKWIAGEKRTKTTYKENGCSYEIDVSKAYFSPRLGSERLRISNLVKPREKILVLFAGVGPFAILISKKVPSAKIIAIEKNPFAVKEMKENIERNKVFIEAIEGDVKKILKQKRFKKWANRVIMPLPEKAIEFLEEAISSTKTLGVIHLYSFSKKEDPSPIFKEIARACRKQKRRFKVLEVHRVSEYSPSIEQVCVSFKVY